MDTPQKNSIAAHSYATSGTLYHPSSTPGESLSHTRQVCSLLHQASQFLPAALTRDVPDTVSNPLGLMVCRLASFVYRDPLTPC